MTSTQKIVIQGHILPIPTLFRDLCSYCNSQQVWQADHESEIMRKAKKLCQNPENHFADTAYSCLDFLDHAHCTPTEQFHTLTTIHDATGCTCLHPLETQIAERLTHTDPPTLAVSDVSDSPELPKDHSDIPTPSITNPTDSLTTTDSPKPHNSINPLQFANMLKKRQS